MPSSIDLPHAGLDDAGSAAARRVVVAVGGKAPSDRLVTEAKRLADALGFNWEAVHVETPETLLSDNQEAAQLLANAAAVGASIATVPAGDVATGLATHLSGASTDYLVLGASTRPRRLTPRRQSLLEHVMALPHAPALLIIPSTPPTGPSLALPVSANLFDKSTARAHGLTLLLVTLTLLLALSLQRLAGARVLDLLFLFPVITAAAQFGLRPALTAAATSVAAYNFFLIAPYHTLGFKTPQSVLMAAVMIIVAIYTSIITGRLRSRMQLSDRSASENARIAAFGQSLALAADWDTTGQLVCEELTALLQVQAAVLREKAGTLEVSGATPAAPVFSPVDRAALDWCWENGLSAGSGTDALAAADWQFQPLKTSLGMLAVLAIARPDGRDPVRADQAILLSTLVAQASLAHERLRLEDQMRAER
jgi:two-component system sensor histidine kinase KdpD